jgi:hypothetical protein
MQRFRFDSWGALNQEVEPEYVEQGELVECENIDLSVTGKLKPAIENSIKLNTSTVFTDLDDASIPKYLTCLESPSGWTPASWGESNYDYILFFKKEYVVCYTGLNKNTKVLDTDMPDTVHDLYTSSTLDSISISKIGDSYIIVDGGTNKKWAEDVLIGIGLDYSGSEVLDEQVKPQMFELKPSNSSAHGEPDQKWLCICSHENESPIVGFHWSTQILALETIRPHEWKLPWGMAISELASTYRFLYFYKANLFSSELDTEILENVELSGSSYAGGSKWYYETEWIEANPTNWWPVWNIKTDQLYPSGDGYWWEEYNIDTDTLTTGDAVAKDWSTISPDDSMNGYWYIQDPDDIHGMVYFLMFYSGSRVYPTFSSLSIGVDSIPDPSSIWKDAMEMNIWKLYWGTPYTNHLPKHSYSIGPVEDSVTSIFGPDFTGYYEFAATLESLFAVHGVEESDMFSETIELNNDFTAIVSTTALTRLIDNKLWSELWPRPTSRTYGTAGVIPHDFVNPGKVYAVRYIYRSDNIDTMLTPLIYLNDENEEGFHEGIEVTAGAVVRITIGLCLQYMLVDGTPENVYCEIYRGDSDGDLYNLETIPVAATPSDLSASITHLDYYDTSADANLSTVLEASDYSAIAPPAGAIASEYVADQLYLAKGSKLHWSDYGAPEQFSELHTTLFDENITALENIGGNLAVIMPGSINVYRPIDEIGVIQKSLSEVGCESDSKTANSKSLVFLINDDALWGFNGTKSVKISGPAKTYYDAIISGGSNILIEANIMNLYIAYTDSSDNCRTLKLSASGKNRWGLIDPGIQVYGLCSTPDNRIIACGAKLVNEDYVEAFSSIEGGTSRTEEDYKVVTGIMRFMDPVALRGVSAMSKHFIGTSGTTVTVIARSLLDTVSNIGRVLSESGNWFRDRFNIKSTAGRASTIQVQIEGNKSDVKEVIVEVSGNGPTAAAK